jgi:signal transduction histidine kinase
MLLPDYRLLFESIPGLLLAIAPDFSVLAASKQYMFATHASANLLYNQPVLHVFPFNTLTPDLKTDLESTLQLVIETGKSATIHIGSEAGNWLVTCTGVFSTDDALNYILLHLEQNTDSRAEQLNSVINELKNANHIKDEFLINVAHDLRAPMHVISGYAQIVLSESGNKLTEEHQQYLAHIVSKATALGELVSGLLAYTHIKDKAPHKALTNMRDAVLDALQTIKENSKNFTADIRIGNLPDAVCDTELINRVWYQLISNAVKYSATKKNAVIEIGYGPVNGTYAYYVKDNGVGFDMAYVQKLFTPLERLHNEDDYPGAAIGLALVKLIVEKHNGKVMAEAKENEYALFSFTLPLNN